MTVELASTLPPIPATHGPIGLLSSDEFLPGVEMFDRALLASARGPRVALIVAAAGGDADNAARHGIEHYTRLGAKPFVVPVLERGQAGAGVLEPFDVLFMCGGSPRALLRTLLGSPLWEEALQAWRNGATLAGSSAGAMALCEQCMIPGPGDRVPTRWTNGLGPVNGVGLAVHASSRPDSWLKLVRESSPCSVVALDDQTGIVMHPAASPTIHGPGRVRVL